MKKNKDYRYTGISSFEDIRLEKARLILKSKLMESKLNLHFIQLRESFSIAAIARSIFRESILPRLSGLLGFFLGNISDGSE